MIDQLRQAGRDARNSSAAIILVLASVVSACAAVAGLTSSVTVAAAVAAVLSGGRVLWSELIVPRRIRIAESATRRVIIRNSQQGDRSGTAFHIAADRWITAQHIIADNEEIFLRTEDGEAPAQVLYQNSDDDAAVLAVDTKWAWRPRIARSLPSPGDPVKVVGWTRVGDDRRQVALDYVVQGPGQRLSSKIALLGAASPQHGFSGAPVIDMRNGRVVGIFSSFSHARPKQFADDPDPVAIIFATPVSAIPAKYL